MVRPVRFPRRKRGQPVPDLVRRDRALQKTVARYRDRPIDFRRFDCIKMLRAHLAALGHRGLPEIPAYRTAEGALKALRKAGFETIGDLLDSILPRIPAARALPGDVILLQGDGPLDCVTISLGAKVMGWHGDHEACVNMIPLAIKGAWRG